MRNLDGKVAVITGGTFGVGRGIASTLAEYGARVFVTGRSAHDDRANQDQTTGIRCDHRVDAEVTAAFERVAREAGKIDILVNNVWGGYERMVEDGTFTWTKPFWEQGSGAGTPCLAPASAPTTTQASSLQSPWLPDKAG
jgi:dehydrogenase/reductase SDR family protein 1